MADLTDDDVREILRIVDESSVDELRIQTPSFTLHVVRDGAPVAPEPDDELPLAAPAADDATAVVAPMLGTFYRAEAPGRPPYVEVGSVVGADTVVGLIEVMKMMNSVSAGVAGTVVEVCADNAQLVEFGQPLMRVRPGG
jgi:acetyl-CoA carboxylase biotin carboxyl carrier protein